MGIPHALKILQLGRDVAKGGKLADPIRLGAIPREIANHKRILPTLMHGKRITFGEQVSTQGKNRSRRAWFPNVVYCPLYSRSLDMVIWTRLSTQALRRIDACGGFDEYITTTSPTLITCPIAQMYRDKVLEQFGKTPADPKLVKDRLSRDPSAARLAQKKISLHATCLTKPVDRIAREQTEMIEILGERYGKDYAGQLEQAFAN